MESEDNSSNLRVASFSCYLKTPEENFVLKLAGSEDPAPSFISAPETSILTSLGGTQSELSIFGADKYFNMKMDYENGIQKEGFKDLHRLKPNFTPRTPSTSSEACSWNTQSALLQRNPCQAKQSRAAGKRFFPSFGCNGPCSTKKDVYVNETVNSEASYGTKLSRPGFKKREQFAFPILNRRTEALTVKKHFQEKVEEELPRKSLEVFGSDTVKKGDIAKNLERKLSVLTWDAIPKAQNLPLTTTYGISSTICEDMASDASSDLFEIENISGTGFSLSTSPPTQYAPSEASIEWSVVTASVADFSSAVSDYDEKNIIGILGETAKNKGGTEKEARKSRPSGLLGCKTQKAVRVAESAYRTIDKPTIKGQMCPSDNMGSGKLKH